MTETIVPSDKTNKNWGYFDIWVSGKGLIKKVIHFKIWRTAGPKSKIVKANLSRKGKREREKDKGNTDKNEKNYPSLLRAAPRGI